MDDKSYAALRKTFESPDPHSHGVFKMLENIYPALAKKVFENNRIMQRMVMSNYNSMDILKYPVCGRCESIAAWYTPLVRNSKVIPRCRCTADHCGHTTTNPVTFRTWVMEEIRKKAPSDIAEELTYTVDRVAQHMFEKAKKDYLELYAPHAANIRTTKQLIVPGSGQPSNKKLILPN